jgi:hypothetical protein
MFPGFFSVSLANARPIILEGPVEINTWAAWAAVMAMEAEFFDSLEEAQARLREAMEAADARVRPWQAAVKVGDCFIADGGEEELLVFGEVLKGYREAHLRHYRFCRCHSVPCPEVEVGDLHVSSILCLVSRQFLEAMRQERWEMAAGQRPRPACRMEEQGMRLP